MRWIVVFLFLYFIPLIVLFKNYNKLAEKENFLQTVIDNISCYISCFDADGNWLFVNQHF